MGLLSGKKRRISEGTRARVLAFFLVGISSGGLGFLAVVHLDQSALFEQMTAYQTWTIVASALGGILALFLAGDRVGSDDGRRLLRGIVGGVWVTFVGALIGGTLSLPLYGTMFGPFIVVVTLAGAPLLAVIWAFNLVAIHVLMNTYQKERDSIFTPAPSSSASSDAESLSIRMRGKFI